MDDLSKKLAEPIEASVSAHGATPQAVWLDRTDALDKGVRRCDALLRMVGSQPDFTILDLGCGPGLSLDYLEMRFGDMSSRYLGIDISRDLVSVAQSRWPSHRFEVRDIITQHLARDALDYTILNGVLTARYTNSVSEMERFAMALLAAAFDATRIGLSFNVMSPHVEWERDDLFHWSLDASVGFCKRMLSRHVNVIADYGLYEYTVQVLRNPHPVSPLPHGWSELDRGSFVP